MLPEIWGKHAWNFLHLVTLAYPDNPSDDDKTNYYNFFHSVKNVLPCRKCCNNMHSHLKKIPLTEKELGSKSSLVKWCIDLHNMVNYYTGKSMLSYGQCMNQFNNLTNKKSEKNYYFYYFVVALAIAIIAFIGYTMYYQKN